MDKTLKLAVGSIAVGLLVLGLKYYAYVLTGVSRSIPTHWGASSTWRPLSQPFLQPA